MCVCPSKAAHSKGHALWQFLTLKRDCSRSASTQVNVVWFYKANMRICSSHPPTQNSSRVSFWVLELTWRSMEGRVTVISRYTSAQVSFVVSIVRFEFLTSNWWINVLTSSVLYFPKSKVATLVRSQQVALPKCQQSYWLVDASSIMLKWLRSRKFCSVFAELATPLKRMSRYVQCGSSFQ